MRTDEDVIESIVREYMSFINAKNFEQLRSAPYFSSKPSSSFEYGSSEGDSLENHVKAFEEHCKRHPDRQTEIVDITVTVGGDLRATALLNTLLTDGTGLEIPGATSVTLRKVGGEWKVTDVSGMRGPGPMSSK